ncbi:MAG: signal recognition particle-docking protein FtsY [Gammaproteobacteria bacterium]|nr:MAG: signal recognition particle-docking protein FtsY [Gammaproteobacteria bacterium]
MEKRILLLSPEQKNRAEKPKNSISLTQRLKTGLNKTRQALFGNLFDGQGKEIESLLEELEMRLLMADAGIEATNTIVDELRHAAKSSDDVIGALHSILVERLLPHERPLTVPESHTPFVILIVGVNGAGKTTTIGKLASRFQQQGKTVMLAAGDTFRAAAVEQLKSWGESHGVPVVAQNTGADSASVIYDAFAAAQARGVDILLADTAGRLHTKSNLMDELEKIKRVLGKLDNVAPHETLLVLDAGTGQNALAQAQQFHQSVGITGLALTKLDGTAKGGILFALADQFDFPVRFIGVGEQADDLREFTAVDFVNALLDLPTDTSEVLDN